MIISKKIENDELYLYMNGELVYKRWLKLGYSKVFDVMAYDKYTLTSIHDFHYEDSKTLFSFQAKLTLKQTSEGGRKTGIISGYRPGHVFEYQEGEEFQAFSGSIIFNDQETIEPGETKEVTINFLVHQPFEKYLDKGNIWWIFEGPNLIGEVEML